MEHAKSKTKTPKKISPIERDVRSVRASIARGSFSKTSMEAAERLARRSLRLAQLEAKLAQESDAESECAYSRFQMF
jgi:hypothetical protein